MGELRTRAELDAEAAQRGGCVLLRRTRRGILVGLYRSDDAGMESDPATPWSTVCEAHGAIVCHASRRDAAASLPHPDGWCDDCRDATASAVRTVDATRDRR